MNWQLPKIERIECIHESSIGFISEIRLKAFLVISAIGPINGLNRVSPLESSVWTPNFGVSNV